MTFSGQNHVLHDFCIGSIFWSSQKIEASVSFLYGHAGVFNRFRKCGYGFKIVEWGNAQAIVYSYFGAKNASNGMREFFHNHKFNVM